MLILSRPDTKGMPSRYHEITGTGFPTALQGRIPMVFIGRVWFIGPWIITGGGWSSGDITTNLAFHDAEPAGLTAEQIITIPESFELADCNTILTESFKILGKCLICGCYLYASNIRAALTKFFLHSY